MLAAVPQSKDSGAIEQIDQSELRVLTTKFRNTYDSRYSNKVQSISRGTPNLLLLIHESRVRGKRHINLIRLFQDTTLLHGEVMIQLLLDQR